MSRVTSKYQVTLPLRVRKALGIRPGDTVAYEIEKGAVKLRRSTCRRATPLDLAYARAAESTLIEWDSPADDRAYRDI